MEKESHFMFGMLALVAIVAVVGMVVMFKNTSHVSSAVMPAQSDMMNMGGDISRDFVSCSDMKRGLSANGWDCRFSQELGGGYACHYGSDYVELEMQYTRTWYGVYRESGCGVAVYQE